ncbi:MAG TPA: lipopolysaccharide transport periplasmic protein LptA [Pseudomonadales bacterium]
MTSRAATDNDDRYQPIEILADSAVRHEKEGLTSYLGNVLIRQGSLLLEADSVTVSSPAGRATTEVNANGTPARFSQKPDPQKPAIDAQANHILYRIDSGNIELSGNARLQQGEASISSEHIVYLLDQQVFRAGTSSSDNTDTTPQRVQVIIPAQKKAPAEPDTP